MAQQEIDEPLDRPALLLVIGPPAVGKMTVGGEIARRTGMRLMHNHLTIDLVVRYFEFGTPEFQRLVDSFRAQLLEAIADSNLPGVVFTYVWAFDEPGEAAAIEGFMAPFVARGGRVHVLELVAPLEERLRRNETPLRLAEKPFKRDLEWSRQHVLELDARYRMTSQGELDDFPDYLRVDNTHLSPEEVADLAVAHFGLPVPHGQG